MQSMTGFGHARITEDGTSVTVDVSGVNRKHQDIRFVLPRELSVLEAALKPQVQHHIARGCVTVSVTYELSAEQRKHQLQIDRPLAQHVADQLRELGDKLGLQGNLTLSDLIAIPGILQDQPAALPVELIRTLAEQALQHAMIEMLEKRSAEGAHLQKDLYKRTQRMLALVEQIESNTGQVLETYRQRVQERIADFGLDIADNDERLAKELAFLAQRSDITEEIVRLKSHLRQVLDKLTGESEEPGGRALEFLCQEMHREFNTLSAKTGDCGIADLALEGKAELARIREQVQNVE